MPGQWSLNVNVAGVKPFEPGAFVRIPTGAYTVEIVDTEMEQKDPTKHPALRFDAKIVEPGDFNGTTVRVYVGTDFTKDGNRKHLRALLLGVGANPAALDNGNIDINQTMFVGKKAYIYVEAAPEGEKTPDGKRPFDNRNFIAPAYYETWKRDHAAGVPAQAQPTGNGTVAPQSLASLAGALNNQGGASFAPSGGAAPQPGAGPKLF